jgi:flagellar biogenesis protein FliO
MTPATAAEPWTQGQEGRSVIRTAINVLAVCALCYGAPAHSASAADTSTANTPSQATPTDARMTRLAQHLAESTGDSTPQTPLAGTPGIPETSGSATDTPATGETPIVTGTPIWRSGLKNTGQGTDRPSNTSWLIQTITALGIVIGLALAVRFIYARLGGKVASHASPVVEVLSRTTVAPRSHVMLLRVGGRVLVVSESTAGMRTLASLEEPEEVADILGSVSAAKPTSISRGFSQLLQRFGDDHEKQNADTDTASEHPAGKVGNSVTGLLARVRSMGQEGDAS